MTTIVSEMEFVKGKDLYEIFDCIPFNEASVDGFLNPIIFKTIKRESSVIYYRVVHAKEKAYCIIQIVR